MKKIILAIALTLPALSVLADDLTNNYRQAFEHKYGTLSQETSCSGLSEKSSDIITKLTPQLKVNVQVYQQTPGRLWFNKKTKSLMEISSVTLNNQAVPFNNTTKTTYISSVKAVTVTNEDLTQSTNYQTTPGTIETGFSGFVQPTLQNGKLTAKVCFTKSQLDSMKDFHSTMTPPTANKEQNIVLENNSEVVTSENPDMVIQLPNVSTQSFFQNIQLSPNKSSLIKLPNNLMLKVSVSEYNNI
jgi:hypothetical protein